MLSDSFQCPNNPPQANDMAIFAVVGFPTMGFHHDRHGSQNHEAAEGSFGPTQLSHCPIPNERLVAILRKALVLANDDDVTE